MVGQSHVLVRIARQPDCWSQTSLMAWYQFKQGDVGKVLRGQFIQTAPDGSEVVLISETKPNGLDCTDAEGRLIVSDRNGTIVFTGILDFVDPRTNGQFTFALPAEMASLDPGKYRAEFKLLIANDQIKTYPTPGKYLSVLIRPAVASTLTPDNFATWGEPVFGEGEIGGMI